MGCNKMDDDIMFGLLIGFVAGVLLVGFLSGWGNQDDIGQLGQAICEEEYGMDYESYINEVLKCKPMKVHYDGIQVEVYNIPNQKEIE